MPALSRSCKPTPREPARGKDAPVALSNLIPDDESTIPRKIRDLERDVRELAPSIARSFAPVIATLQAQTAALAAQDVVIAAQQADLAAQNVQIVAQQASLSSAVANIATLVGQQTTAGVAATVTALTWTSATGYETKASTSIAVPGGYTQALIVANASTVFQDSAANSFQSRVVINGNAGAELNGLANPNSAHSPMHTLFTAVSGSITIAAQVKSGVASGVTTGRISQVSGFAIFFR